MRRRQWRSQRPRWSHWRSGLWEESPCKPGVRLAVGSPSNRGTAKECQGGHSPLIPRSPLNTSHDGGTRVRCWSRAAPTGSRVVGALGTPVDRAWTRGLHRAAPLRLRRHTWLLSDPGAPCRAGDRLCTFSRCCVDPFPSLEAN